MSFVIEYTIFNTLSKLEERFQEICTHLRDVLSLAVMRRKETLSLDAEERINKKLFKVHGAVFTYRLLLFMKMNSVTIGSLQMSGL